MENLKNLEVFKKISLKEFENYVNKYISEEIGRASCRERV